MQARLLRIGEVPSAQAIFAGLLRDDPDFVPAHRGMLLADSNPAALLDRFTGYVAPVVAKWVTKPQAL